MKKYLLTAALPYANGSLHFGHMAGAYIPADIYARHRRLQGHSVKFICGSDEHGVAIMLGAKKEKKSYQDYVDHWHENHKDLFEKFEIKFDFFGRTSSSYHKEEVVWWFKKIHEEGFIEPRESMQLFCNDCENHLPDRFVQGTCYSCGYEQARGDECPQCGIWIEAEKLISPVCQICKSTHVIKKTVKQYYLLLSKYHSPYRKWLERRKDVWRSNVYSFVDSLSKKNLHDRAITRDLDWGIDVPLPHGDGKKIYVWFDAPIGYVSNLKEHLRQTNSEEDYLEDWFQHEDVCLEHFIGKDNIIFHCLIFPIMGMTTKRIRPPWDVPANQYLNWEGRPFSKSSGWHGDMNTFIDRVGVDALRYYLIAIMPENSDASFAWKELAVRVGGELANNIGNLVTRCLKFSVKHWPDGISSRKKFSTLETAVLFSEGIRCHQDFLDKKQFKKGLEQVMKLGQKANDFFTKYKAWEVVKQDKDKAGEIVLYTEAMILVLGVLLSPYLPGLSRKMTAYFGEISEDMRRRIYKGDMNVLDSLIQKPLKIIGKPKILVPKIEED